SSASQATRSTRSRREAANGLVDIGCLDKIQCDRGPVVTVVACILHGSITLLTQDAGTQITTLLHLLESPAPLVLQSAASAPHRSCVWFPAENENKRFLHLAPCNLVPMALWLES